MKKLKKLMHYIYDRDYGFFFDLRITIGAFLEDIGRSWDYAKFGWKCRDWDDAYLWMHTGFKLERIKKMLESDCCDWTDELKHCNRAIELCNHLGNDDYWDIFEGEHIAKWGEPYEIKDDQECVIYKWPNATTDEENEQASKKHSRILDRCSKQREKDRIELLTILKEHSESWWT